MHTLNSIFDHIYILNLKADRKKYIKTQKILSKFNIEAEKFEAVNGNVFKKEFEKRKKIWLRNPENIKLYNYGGSLYRSLGAYGCSLSHIKILEDAKKKEYKRILILEDDIMLHKKFNIMFNNYYKKIKNKNWKFLMLGSSMPSNINSVWNESKNIVNFLSIIFRERKKSFNLLKNKIFKIKKCYIPINEQCYGSFALGIDHSIFDDLIKEYKNFEKPNDGCNIKVTLEKYKNLSYVFKPDLIIADLENTKTYKSRSKQDSKLLYKLYNWNTNNYT